MRDEKWIWRFGLIFFVTFFYQGKKVKRIKMSSTVFVEEKKNETKVLNLQQNKLCAITYQQKK